MAPEDPPRLSKDPSKTLHRPSKRRPKTPQDLPETFPRPAQDPPSIPAGAAKNARENWTCFLHPTRGRAPGPTGHARASGPRPRHLCSKLGGLGAIFSSSWWVWGTSWLQVVGSEGGLWGDFCSRGSCSSLSFFFFYFFSFSPSFSLFSLIRPGQIWRTNKGFFFFSSFLPSSQSFYSFSLIRPGQLVRTNGGFFTFLPMNGLEANLGASWNRLGRFWCHLGDLGGNFTRFCGCCKNL